MKAMVSYLVQISHKYVKPFREENVTSKKRHVYTCYWDATGSMQAERTCSLSRVTSRDTIFVCYTIVVGFNVRPSVSNEIFEDGMRRRGERKGRTYTRIVRTQQSTGTAYLRTWSQLPLSNLSSPDYLLFQTGCSSTKGG